MSAWLPALVLPNVSMQQAIECGDIIFAPWHDLRAQEALREDADFALFMQRFTDAFGMELRPLILMVRSIIPRDRLNMSMATTLRDSLSMSVIPTSYAKVLIYGRSLEFGYSDVFDFYPWMPGNAGDGGMTAITPAVEHSISSESFTGSHPRFSR